MQAREEVEELMQSYPDDLLWERPAGVASVGFHLQHLAGVLDRLFTYAKGLALTQEQLNALSTEGKCPEAGCTARQLVKIFNQQVEKALQQLRHTNEETLLEPRGVGRAQIPSNVLGLLVHGAEHTMRHVGQLTVTARVMRHSAE
ncbi:hypothetical protein GCM10027443_37680 [Pontibacter brevis]